MPSSARVGCIARGRKPSDFGWVEVRAATFRRSNSVSDPDAVSEESFQTISGIVHPVNAISSNLRQLIVMVADHAGLLGNTSANPVSPRIYRALQVNRQVVSAMHRI